MPNTRLVWNFELGKESLLNNYIPPAAGLTIPEGSHAEYRAFYPEDAIISLPLPNQFEHFSLWDYKERNDTYYILTGRHLNIKARKEKILYKPLIKNQDPIFWYGKKQRLDQANFVSTVQSIPNGSPETRLQWLQQEAIMALVHKDAFITKLFQGELLLEIAKLRFEQRIFYTIGLEAKASLAPMLQSILPIFAHPLAVEMDYVSFLKMQLRIPL